MKKASLIFLVVLILALFLAGCCILGDACESGIMDAVYATKTAIAQP